MRLLIKNGRVINPSTGLDEITDVLVVGGKIKKIGSIEFDETAELIDAAGLWVVPGLIDVHVHLREPGFEYKEDIESGTASAVAGGFTTVCCMPNTKPTTDSAKIVQYILKKNREKGSAHVIPVGAITVGQKGETLAPLENMVDSGAGAISEDGRSVLNARIMRAAMEEAKRLDIPVLSHCEDDELAKGGCMNEGPVSEALGLIGIPNEAEDIITARDILLARKTGCKLHLCHVSTKNSVEMIREAKKNGVRVTAEACPHHFTLTDEAVNGVDTNTKMNPPLRAKEDMEAIKMAVIDGTIDCIATDHAPHAEAEKNVSYDKAANGIVGFETALGLTMTHLVHSGLMSPMALVERMSYNPALMMGIDKGRLEEGLMADITLIDPEATYTVNKEAFRTKGRNTPYDGWTLKGKVMMTIVKGNIKYRA